MLLFYGICVWFGAADVGGHSGMHFHKKSSEKLPFGRRLVIYFFANEKIILFVTVFDTNRCEESSDHDFFGDLHQRLLVFRVAEDTERNLGASCCRMSPG